jgi:DNA-binding transcriptional ArsR family regulator
MDSVLRQSICLTINKSGLTPGQIAKRVDANEAYVREALDALEAEELVEKVGRGRYRNTFVALGAEDWIQLSREIRPIAERVADLLAEGLPELQAAWESSPKPAQGFGWDIGIWLACAIFVCHYGRVRKGSFREFLEPPLHPASGKRYWGGGREKISPEPLWNFSWAYHGGEGFSHALLWPTGLGFDRRPWPNGQRVNWSNERLLLLRSIASGSRDIDSAAKAADLDMERVREAAADAIELGLVEQRQDGLVLTFPVFTSEDDDALLPAVDRVSERIAGVLDPVPLLVDAKLREFGYGPWEEQFSAWQGTPAYEAAAEACRILFNHGYLPHPGDPAPTNFCMWGLFEGNGLFSYKKRALSESST